MIYPPKAICVISGPTAKVDLCRANTAIEHERKFEEKIPFWILGAGPELTEALAVQSQYRTGKLSPEEKNFELNKLDHHLELYFQLKSTGNQILAFQKPKTLVTNILEGFRGCNNGKYAIVTEPWHYEKFDYVQQELKEKGRISKDLDFYNIPSQDLHNYNEFKKFLSNLKTRWELLRV